MSRYKNVVDTQKAHIYTLTGSTGGYWSGILVRVGWLKAPDQFTVHVPTDPRTGSTRLWWDVPPENIYAFALYIGTQAESQTFVPQHFFAVQYLK